MPLTTIQLAGHFATFASPIPAHRLALPAPADREECDGCGGLFDDRDMVPRTDTLLCSDCDSGRFKECSECGSEIDTESDDLDADGMCESCHDERHFTCGGCLGEFPLRDSYGDPNYQTNNAGEHFCDSCYDDTYFYCDGCDSECLQDDYGSDGMCIECSRSVLVRSYETDVLDHLEFLGPEKECLGVELEVECVGWVSMDDSARRAVDSLGGDFVILKEDGSINHGFEIVTAPAPISVHRDRWPRFLGSDQAKRGLKSFDTNTCGMHVHVSRAGISPLTLGKILVFINDPRNHDPITRLAGRSGGYGKTNASRKATDAKRTNYDRYEAINLQGSNTVEFRLFRGTLDHDGFMKNLEFVVASIAFCKDAGLRGLTWANFSRWISRTPKCYPHLSAWMRGNGYIAPVKGKAEPAAVRRHTVMN